VPSYSELLSRPGQTLLAHLQGTAEKARTIIEGKHLNRDFTEVAYFIGAAHDFGKATTFFQQYVHPGGENVDTIKKRHSSLSAFFCYHLLQKQVESGSLDSRDALIGWYVIQRHHGNLTDLSLGEQGEIQRKIEERHTDLLKDQVQDIQEHTLSQIEEIYQTLGIDPHLDKFFEAIESGDLFQSIKREYFRNDLDLGADAAFYLNILFLYSVLLEADKLDASGTDLPERHALPEDAVAHYRSDVFGTPQTSIDELRKDAAMSVIDFVTQIDLSKRIVSITLPTGAGKTLIGLDAALTLRQRIQNEQDFQPRLVYVLPFLTIIEQNHEVFQKVLQNAGVESDPELLLKHHHLAAGYLEKDHTDSSARQSLLLTDSWHSEIVVTTFVQFFESLITHRNARAKKFNNMANSIIILDEVQAIPRRYWKLVKTLLQNLCERYNSWIILMTATNPLLFEPENEITELVQEGERYYEQLDRVDYYFDLDKTPLEEFHNLVTCEFQENPDKDFMLVLNTIQSSKDTYETLREALEDDYPETEFINLSTHVLPQERLDRIEAIKKSDKRKLIVTTQLIEAGVDIDIDIIYRDLAPLDSIIQTAGRCNRESENEKGEVHVVKLIDENTGRSFASYIYDSVLLDITESILGDIDHQSEKDFNYEAARKYFELCKTRGSDEEDVLEYLRNLQFASLGQFQLIQEDVADVSVYIERTEDDQRLREEVEEILETTYGYRRKAKMLPLKREFYNRVINVRVPRDSEDALGLLESIEGAEHLYVVPMRVVNQWYDTETGFHFPENTFDLRFI